MTDPARSPVDPYATGLMSEAPYVLREPLEARFVGVMDASQDARGLQLIPARTRCVRRHEVHELILTDETGAAPGATVNRIHYLGFVEFQTGGVLVEGDTLTLGGTAIGVLAGFDESHFPNHYNIVITGPRRASGIALGQKPGDAVTFTPRN